MRCEEVPDRSVQTTTRVPGTPDFGVMGWRRPRMSGGATLSATPCSRANEGVRPPTNRVITKGGSGSPWLPAIIN